MNVSYSDPHCIYECPRNFDFQNLLKIDCPDCECRYSAVLPDAHAHSPEGRVQSGGPHSTKHLRSSQPGQIFLFTFYLSNTGLITGFSKSVLHFDPPLPPLKCIWRIFVKLVLPRKLSFYLTVRFPLKRKTFLQTFLILKVVGTIPAFPTMSIVAGCLNKIGKKYPLPQQ